MATEFKLPDLGEGVEAGDVVSVLVSVGDTIEQEQGIVELETDKALIEVPSSFAGVVTRVHVSAGDRVPVGQTLITVEEAGTAEAAPADLPAAKPEPVEAPAAAPPAVESAAAPKPEAAPLPEPAPFVPEPVAGDPTPAAPATRRLARELGVDLSQVVPTGPGGRIVENDVKAHIRGGHFAAPAPSTPAVPALPDFGKWGKIERQPLTKIRQIIAKNMSLAWGQVPHVTQFDKADCTELEAFRQRNKAAAEAHGGRLTPTVLILKAVITALKAFPQVNASLDVATHELILKQYYHLGIAVDTERGLMVPVIKDVDRKDLFQLAAELTSIGERARTNKIGLDELQGGTFTITNLGSLGVGAFTPIVNYPEVAILGLGRSVEEAVVKNGRIEPRLMPIALSYDHRVIDGADGARFVRRIVDSLENPELMLLGG
ncbi:MAG: dihydrolipoamide acetyltransferase family protein [bacterium]|nr:dihydrolipoamide acetyltransferase family protein [bacterium]